MITILFSVLFISFMECILSLDNALVLSVLVKHLPKEQHKKALTYGIYGAFIFRALALFFITHIITAPWIKYIGGAYLLYLSLTYFFKKPGDDELPENKTMNFWKTVLMVEVMDITFSADSILAAVGISQNYWIVFTGGIIGIIMMRFAASFFVGLIDKFPTLEITAYSLIGVIGAKLILEQIGVDFESIDSVFTWAYWGAFCMCIVAGFREVEKV